jgi:hypothetical protein
VPYCAPVSPLFLNSSSCSYHFVKYNGDQNRLVIYADDVVPRWVVAGCLLDYHTVAGADKFGNIFILRLPANATDDIDDDPSGIAAFPFLVLFWYCYFVGAKVVWQRGLLSGAPQKLECLVNYHVGELVVSLQKVIRRVLLYMVFSHVVSAGYPRCRRWGMPYIHHN